MTYGKVTDTVSNSQSLQCKYDQYRKHCSKIIFGISELFFQNSHSIKVGMLKFLRVLLENSKAFWIAVCAQNH